MKSAMTKKNVHIPGSEEEFLGSKDIQFQDDFHHEDTQEKPVCLVDVKPDKPGVQKDHEVKEITEEPVNPNIKVIGWRTVRFICFTVKLFVSLFYDFNFISCCISLFLERKKKVFVII